MQPREILPAGFRRCCKCKKIKSLAAFRARKQRGKDGKLSKCINCCKVWYSENAEDILLYEKRWRQDHPQASSRHNKRYRQKHPEKIRAYTKRRYAENIGGFRERLKRWTQENPEKFRENCRAQARKRRARKIGVNENFSAAEGTFVRSFNGNRCMICGGNKKAKGRKVLPIDHWLPLSKGHALTMSNAVLLCIECNGPGVKGNRYPADVFDTATIKRIEKEMREQVKAWELLKQKKA